MAVLPPVFLVGFMGSGKSEVGRRLAARLGARFIDLDAEIAKASGASIAEQFANDGEAAFRARESKALETLCANEHETGVIVAPGGGLVADADHRARIARTGGVAVWLDAPLEELERRVAHDPNRPRWGTREDVARLFAERADTYAQADVRVDASGDDPETVVARVLDALDDLGRSEWTISRP